MDALIRTCRLAAHSSSCSDREGGGSRRASLRNAQILVVFKNHTEYGHQTEACLPKLRQRLLIGPLRVGARQGDWPGARRLFPGRVRFGRVANFNFCKRAFRNRQYLCSPLRWPALRIASRLPPDRRPIDDCLRKVRDCLAVLQPHGSSYGALIPVSDVKTVAVGHLEIVPTMCRNDRRSDPKSRQPSSDHIGINWFLAIPIETERADMERLVEVADHMSQHPKCLPLAQGRRALVWSSVA